MYVTTRKFQIEKLAKVVLLIVLYCTMRNNELLISYNWHEKMNGISHSSLQVAIFLENIIGDTIVFSRFENSICKSLFKYYQNHKYMKFVLDLVTIFNVLDIYAQHTTHHEAHSD